MSNRVLIKLDISTESPLSVGDKKAGRNPSETLPYIPGRALRGALAQALLNHEPAHGTDVCQADCDFCLLFNGNDRAIFRNAYPTQGEIGVASRPMPTTMMQCKLHGSEHGRQDILSDLLLNHLCGRANALFCKQCKARLEKASGFVWRNQISDVAIKGAMERQLARVGIDRIRRAAADEILYSVNVLSGKFKGHDGSFKPMTFHCKIDCPASIGDEVVQLLESEVDHIGSGSSRGLGQVSIKASKTDFSEQASSVLKERVRKWNLLLADKLEKNTQEALIPLKKPWADLPARSELIKLMRSGSAGFVRIDLISDAVLDDIAVVDGKLYSTGRQCFVLSEEALRKYAGYEGKATLLLSNASPFFKSGWNLAWKLPRDVSLVSKAGASFVFWIENIEAWLPHLIELERSGIGREREQGFGEIEICSEEHTA